MSLISPIRQALISVPLIGFDTVEWGSDVLTMAGNSGNAGNACYSSGSLIRTDGGDVAVESLKIGDVVMTASGGRRSIRWIGHRSYAGRFANNNPDVLPICFKAGSLEEGVPARDLWVSPKHAMFLDGILIPAEHLVNGVTVVKATHVDKVTYWHVELDSHDVLVAEGAAAESFIDDNSRNAFQNNAEYAALYPDADPVEPVYCAPRHEDGLQLETVRRRIAARAGIEDEASNGRLIGAIDQIHSGVLRGWAQNESYPDASACLDVMSGDVLVGQVLANKFRADLAARGIGDHAFEFRIPSEMSEQVFEIRRSSDGALLLPDQETRAA